MNIGDSTNHNADVHIHGELHFDEEGDGIVFGPIVGDASRTTITVDSAVNVDLIGIPVSDYPQWNFGTGMNVNISEQLSVAGVTNNGVLNQTGTVTISSSLDANDVSNNDGSLTVDQGISARWYYFWSRFKWSRSCSIKNYC